MNTRRTNLDLFGDPQDLAEAVAEKFVESLKQRLATGRPVFVALPGGRIYGRFFVELATHLRNHSSLLRPLHFFWSDERSVPPDSAESNYRLAHENLLHPLGFPAEQCHRIRGEIESSRAAAEAEAELRATMRAPQTVPALDYVFLGMGEDGHVASLFPGETPDHAQSPALFRAVIGPKPPPCRVTMGYPMLWAAKELWILVSGKEKSGALRQSLLSGAGTPLGRVLARCNKAFIFADFDPSD